MTSAYVVEVVPANTTPQDLAELARRTRLFGEFSSTVHLDVADGAFVPALSWPYQGGQWAELESMASTSVLPQSDTVRYEVHLMVEDPLRVGELFARAGCKPE